MKRITFGIDDFKFVVDMAEYGFQVIPLSDPEQKSVCCFGDYNLGCIFARRQKDTALVTYCYPYVPAEEPSFTTKRWADVSKEFTLKFKSKNNRILVAKPVIENNAIIGVRFLTQDSDEDTLYDVVKLTAKKKENGQYVISTAMNAYVINPD